MYGIQRSCDMIGQLNMKLKLCFSGCLKVALHGNKVELWGKPNAVIRALGLELLATLNPEVYYRDLSTKEMQSNKQHGAFGTQFSSFYT